MMSDEADPPFETREIGTPLDYSDDLYRFYVEVRDVDRTAERLTLELLGHPDRTNLHRLTHGFEVTMPLQSAPDIVRLLAQRNIAVYQIVRYARVDSTAPD